MQIALTINEPATGRRLWTHAFSGLRQDILTIQDQIYRQITAAMDLKLTSEDLGAPPLLTPPKTLSAYDLYLSGRRLLGGKRDGEKPHKGPGLLPVRRRQRSCNFALAYTGISDASRYMYELTKDGIWTDRAESAATRAQQLNDNLPEGTLLPLGSVYTSTGKTAQAIAELKRALQLAPNSDEAYRRLGRAYRSAGRKDEALASFQKAIVANPYYWLNHNLLGIAYIESGDNERALQAFRKVTEVDPSRASGWANIGSIDHSLGKWEDSVAMFKKAVDLQPSALNYSNLGAGLFFLGRCDEAKTYFEKALGLNADQVSLGNLAGAYRCVGQAAEASKYYR